MTGLAVRAIRIRAGLTQQQLAKLMGYSQGAISEIERGVHPVTDRFRLKLAQIVDFSDAEIAETIRRAKAVQAIDDQALG